VRREWWAATVAVLTLSGQLALQSTSAAMRATTATTGSQWSADQLQPASNLSVLPGATCVMNLSWTISPSTWATGYKVYRTANPATNPYSLVATVFSRATSTYADSYDLKLGLRYYYVIRSYRGSWVSAESNSANALAPAACV
jgi:hypothetical protein